MVKKCNRGKAFDYKSTCHQEETYDRFYKNKELRGGWIDHQITHWTGYSKPWMLHQRFRESVNTTFLESLSSSGMNNVNASRKRDILKYGCAPYLDNDRTRRVWFELLSYASRRLNIDLNFTSDFPMKDSELGKWAPNGAKDESKDQIHVKWKR